ncbi:hypothetical protein [Sinomonas flava]|uniref:hypothetical protein n=1 Tax=Sinomonas flava TaxID=496857 RepID=UPI0039A5B2F6
MLAAAEGDDMAGVRTTDDGAWLAGYLCSPDRGVPTVVVSVHPDKPGGHIDAELIAREIDGLAEVIRIVSGPATRALTGALPPGREVYGNAVRAYSLSLDWLDDMYRSPLHLSQGPQQAARAARDVVHDVVSMAPAPKAAVAPTRTAPVMARGVVLGFAAEGHRAVVAMENGSRATISQEAAVPGVRLDWILRVGQRLEGLLDADRHTLDISGLRQEPRLAECYQSGEQVLAFVVEVRPEKARLRLWPGKEWTVGLDAVTSNPLDGMDMLLNEGDVVVTRFSRVSGAVRLSVIDADEEEPVVAAPALILGGPPWLERDRALGGKESGTAASPAPEGQAAPTNGLGTALQTTQLALEAARREVAVLRDQSGRVDGGTALAPTRALEGEVELLRKRLASREATLEQMTATVDKLSEELARRRVEAGRQRKSARAREQQLRDHDSRRHFVAPEAWLLHEVYEAWVRVVPPHDKARWPLPEARSYVIGPRFAASLHHERVAARLPKAFDICVRVLVGASELLAGLDVHPFRSGAGPEDRQKVRTDGATLWRASVQKNTPAALRLHFWRLPDGRIELDSVHPHDQDL